MQVVRDILNILPSIDESLPPSIQMAVMEDSSIPIQDSVDEVQFTLILTIFLVIAVIYLFLHDVRATVIPSLAVPLSIVATYAFMFAAGFSLDNLSLMALILVVGFVVDDAIVMLENIVRHRLERACLRHPEVRGFGGDVAFKFGREGTETAVDDGHGKIPCWKLRERGRGEGVLRAAAPRVLF